MESELGKIQAIADRFGLSLEDLATLVSETDAARGMLTQSEAEQGLSNVVAIYVRCLASTAERIVDPTERLFADRFVGQVVELLADQLASALHVRN